MMKFKAVIWDVYGTLVHYNLGDLDDALAKKKMFVSGINKALKKFKIKEDADSIYKRFVFEADKEHKKKEKRGTKFPEIVEEKIWKNIFSCSLKKAKGFTLFIEQNVNDPGFYKGARDTLIKIKKMGLKNGIISNSQFCTLIMLEKQLNKKLYSVFDKNLCLYSFKEGFSKPNPKSFAKLKKRLKGIKPSEILFVGNDLYKDIYCAHKAGFKTVLLTKDAKGKKKVKPDYKIKEIPQLLKIIKGK